MRAQMHKESYRRIIRGNTLTKQEVKHAIQRGLGKGYLAVRDDPERYRELVLWACGRNLAFDTQCEGIRAWYDYQLILCYL